MDGDSYLRNPTRTHSCRRVSREEEFGQRNPRLSVVRDYTVVGSTRWTSSGEVGLEEKDGKGRRRSPNGDGESQETCSFVDSTGDPERLSSVPVHHFRSSWDVGGGRSGVFGSEEGRLRRGDVDAVGPARRP